MAVKGPRLTSELTLEIANAEKQLLRYTASVTKASKRMVGASRQQRRAEQDNIRAKKAQIGHTKEYLNQKRRELSAVQRTTAAKRRETAATRQATHSFGTFSKAIGTSITLWYTARTAVFAFRNALERVIDVYKRGEEAITDFRMEVIATSAIMIPSIQEGTTAAEKMAIAWEYNTKMLKDLELVAARHISTGKSLQQVYSGMIIAGVFPTEADVENMAKLTDFITVYTKGQRLEIQLMQEVRGLMDGQIRTQNKLAYTLDRLLDGELKEYLQKWREAGRNAEGELIILEEITNRLGDIGILQGEILNTTQTWRNTLETITTRILREGTQKAYEDILTLLKESARFFYDIQEVNGRITVEYTAQARVIKSILNEGWERIKDLVRGFVGGELKDTRNIISNILDDVLFWVSDAGPQSVQLGEELRVAADAVYGILKNIKTVITSIFIMRAPVWFLKILEVAAGVGAAGAAGTVTGLAALGGAMVALAKIVVEDLGASFESGATAIDMFNNEIEKTEKRIQKVRVPIEDFGNIIADFWAVEGAKEIPLEPTFPEDKKTPFEKLTDEQMEALRERGEAFESYLAVTSDAQWEIWKKDLQNLEKTEKEKAKAQKESLEERREALEDFYAVSSDAQWKHYKQDLQNLEERNEEIKRLNEEILDIEQKTWASGYKARMMAINQEIQSERDKIAELEKLRQQDTELYKKHVEKKMVLERKLKQTKIESALESADITISAMGEMFRMLAEQNKKYFAWYKALAIAEAMINTTLAITKVYAELPIWAAIPASAALAASLGAQVAAIAKQKPPEYEGLAEGGVSEGGFSAASGAYGNPTYIMAEKKGKPEAVVPLDKYVVKDKDAEGGKVVNYNYFIMAQDPQSFRDFAKRNPRVFREQFVNAVNDNDPRVIKATKTAVGRR